MSRDKLIRSTCLSTLRKNLEKHTKNTDISDGKFVGRSSIEVQDDGTKRISYLKKSIATYSRVLTELPTQKTITPPRSLVPLHNSNL